MLRSEHFLLHPSPSQPGLGHFDIPGPTFWVLAIHNTPSLVHCPTACLAEFVVL